jgi:hypothetical protein
MRRGNHIIQGRVLCEFKLTHKIEIHQSFLWNEKLTFVIFLPTKRPYRTKATLAQHFPFRRNDWWVEISQISGFSFHRNDWCY